MTENYIANYNPHSSSFSLAALMFFTKGIPLAIVSLHHSLVMRKKKEIV
jgi:hypothetical protein